MAGLDPAIHVFTAIQKTWMPGTSPGMTMLERLSSESDWWTADRSLRCCHHDPHDMRRFESDAHASPHPGSLRIDPFLPYAGHLALSRQLGAADQSTQAPPIMRRPQAVSLL